MPAAVARGPPRLPTATSCCRPSPRRSPAPASSAAMWACWSSPSRARARSPRRSGGARAQEVLDTLARRARAWLPAGDVVAWLADGRLAVLLEGVDAGACAVVARRLAALLAEPVPTAGARSCPCPRPRPSRLADGPAGVAGASCCAARSTPRRSTTAVGGDPRAPGASHASARRARRRSRPALPAGEVSVALQPIVALGTLPRHDASSPSRRSPDGPGRTARASPPSRFVPAARRSGLADLLGATVLAQAWTPCGSGADDGRRRCGPVRQRRAGAARRTRRRGDDPAGSGGRPASSRRRSPSRSRLRPPSRTPPRPAPCSAPCGTPGCGVVLDNFGAAGLSIAALRELPLTGVKLDRSLTADLGRRRPARRRDRPAHHSAGPDVHGGRRRDADAARRGPLARHRRRPGPPARPARERRRTGGGRRRPEAPVRARG